MNTPTPVTKQRLILAVAHFLADCQFGKGLLLQEELERDVLKDHRPTLAVEWHRLREASGIVGYPSVEEATKVLEKILR